MGTIIDAVCTKCNFQLRGILFGGGFRDRSPRVPARRKDNGAFEVSNQLNDENLNFYHHPSMYKGELQGYGIQHMDIMLNKENNLCPSCGNYSMQFIDTGNWD